MKFSRIVIGLALAMLPAMGSTQDASNSAGSIVPTDPATSKATYDQMCAGCHGYRGDGGEGHRGGFSPHIGTLAIKEYMDSVPDDFLIMIIKKGGAYMGKMSTMPAWEKKLSEEDILGLVLHIRSFTKSGGGAAH